MGVYDAPDGLRSLLQLSHLFTKTGVHNPLYKNTAMDNAEQIQVVLENVTFVALGSLVVYQYLHYVVGGWRFWAGNPKRVLLTSFVAIGWAAYGFFFLTYVPSFSSFVDALPFELIALYAPTVLALIGFAVSARFRSFADRMSLRWTVWSVEGPARMIVGVFFLFWYFAGRLPGVVAWVAGPGDWISGFIALFAVRQLTPIAESVGIADPHWSASEYLSRRRADDARAGLPRAFQRNLLIAVSFVAFGIFDFLAAPASTAVSVAQGVVPQEMGQLPLASIPLLLVPQVIAA